VASLESLIHHLQDEFDICIVTQDRDKKDAIPYHGIKYNEWIWMNEGWVRYLPIGRKHWKAIFKVVREEEYNLLYINDLYSPKWGIWPLLIRRLGLFRNVPLLIAPRGQFGAGALGIKKWKKQLFIHFAKNIGLFRGASWHATNEKESIEIREIVQDDVAIFTAPNLPSIRPQDYRKIIPIDPSAMIRLIFLSRISPKKNLEFSISVLGKLKFPLEYDIFGPIDDSIYWNKLLNLIQTLPTNIKVTYKGELHPTQVAETFSQYHAFLLPTLGENFGHVILESLASGCLPIISDRTPWRDLNDQGCGWVIPLENPEEYVAAIMELKMMSAQELLSRRLKATKYSYEFLSKSSAVEKNRNMFRVLCSSKEIQSHEYIGSQ